MVWTGRRCRPQDIHLRWSGLVGILLHPPRHGLCYLIARGSRLHVWCLLLLILHPSIYYTCPLLLEDSCGSYRDRLRLSVREGSIIEYLCSVCACGTQYVVYTGANAFIGLASGGGYEVNHLDIAPTAAAMVLGVYNTIGQLTGTAAPMVRCNTIIIPPSYTTALGLHLVVAILALALVLHWAHEQCIIDTAPRCTLTCNEH